MRLVQGMYSNARSRVRVGEGYSEEFEVKVAFHQGSVLSPLLFIIVLEALSRKFRCGVPWEDLYQGSKFSFRQTCPAGQVLPKIHSSLRKIYLPCFSGVKMKKLIKKT